MRARLHFRPKDVCAILADEEQTVGFLLGEPCEVLFHLLVEKIGTDTDVGLGLSRGAFAIGPLRFGDTHSDHQVVEGDVPAAQAGQLFGAHRVVRAEVDHEQPADTDRVVGLCRA
ncbi:hypothetical protein QR77_17595 [Streptomyces sp. 150FB]|nr:hypothetical protein QR77_17595 [Streptomyces sp. 150FB]